MVTTRNDRELQLAVVRLRGESISKLNGTTSKVSMVATEAVHPDSEDDAWVQVGSTKEKKNGSNFSSDTDRHLDFFTFGC